MDEDGIIEAAELVELLDQMTEKLTGWDEHPGLKDAVAALRSNASMGIAPLRVVYAVLHSASELNGWDRHEALDARVGDILHAIDPVDQSSYSRPPPMPGYDTDLAEALGADYIDINGDPQY